MEKSLIFALIALGAFVSVNSLQCYVCIDCKGTDVNDTMLETCGGIQTTTSSTTTTTPTSVNPGTNETVSTAPPVNPGTNGTESAVNPGTNGTESAVNPGTNGTESVSPPVNPNVNGSESGINSTNGVVNNPDETNSVQPKAIRMQRSILSETQLDHGCTCQDSVCVCEDEAGVFKTFATYADPTYVCFKATVKDQNGTDVILRGCELATIGEQPVCTYAQNQLNATNCHTCTTDKCNDAGITQYSAVALLLVVTSVFIAN